MNLFLDLETTFHTDDKGRTDPSPYIDTNYLVSAGWATSEIDITYLAFKHNSLPDYHAALKESCSYLQRDLNSTTLLIAHNAKFELMWLKACDFKYEGKIACTQIREYVLARGQKLSLKLADICIRENLQHKKTDLVDKYLKDHIGFETMPWEVVQEYGIGDVESLRELYYNQIDRLNAAPHLWPTVNLMEEFCRCLVDIEANGIKIDVAELDRLEEEYKTTLAALKIDLQKIVEDIMGATPINLDSPEQLSQLIYSRKVIDKHVWKDTFNLGTEFRGAVVKPKRKTHYTNKDFVWLVKNQTEILYKTTAEHCNICDGKGKIRKIKKDGQDFNRDTTCKNCSGRGFTLLALKEIAGLRCVPTGVQDVAIGGFSTDKETLQLLAATATGDRKSFLTKILEVNKIEVYLSTFIDGIRRGLRGKDNILHTSFMQCVTATGRLSSRQPNMQNQPRGGTFPVRASFVSRFEDGVMTEADAKQLEFRSVGELSGNKQIFEDIINNIDVHSVTAKFIGCSRQDGKSFTFAPLYGAMPEGKALKIAEYYRHFIKKYSLEEWHGKVATDIINNGGLQRLPSGREFYFKDTKRYPSGGFSNATQIKNYMVQGWATGDIIPIFCVEVWKLLKQVGIRSVLVLTVHDSVCVDTAPEDKKIIIDILNKAWYNTIKIEPIKRWNYEIKIPLEIEIKQGKDLLHLNAI